MTDQATPWAEAHDLARIGELTAQWLEGTLDEHPASRGPADKETGPLVPVLAQLNRAGLVTDFSQPGEDGGSWMQRAAVTGFCSDDTAERLQLAIEPTDLVLLTEPHGDLWSVRIPVSRDGTEQHTWVGGSYDDDYLLTCYSTLPSRGLAALRSAWFVTAFDPAWGRDDRLWAALATALAVPQTSVS